MIIYSITNRLNGKRYIGMTELRLCERWKAHRVAARNGSTNPIHCALRKYGSEAFDVYAIASLIPALGRSDLCELERQIIDQENVLSPNGYNVTLGGEGAALGSRPRKPSPLRGVPWSEARRAAQVRPKGERTIVQKAKRKPRLRVIPLTDAQKFAKRSAIMKQAWIDHRGTMIARVINLPERRAAVAAANTAKNQSEEHKAKMRAAWARDPARREAAAQRMRLANTQQRRA